jgi:hypothetical protein
VKLSVLIPTIEGREESFARLVAEFQRQIKELGTNEVEILSKKDNKEISVGKKRDILYRMANGRYSVQFDDDDLPAPNYLRVVLKALRKAPDCVGYKARCLIDGRIEISDISRKYSDWENYRRPVNGIHHVRTPFMKVPILTEICCEVGVSDMRWGEDHEYSRRISKEIHTEEYINEELYYYFYNKMNQEEMNKRYGIK